MEGLFGYGTQVIDLHQGSHTILTGPNGCGKTHALRTIYALATCDIGILGHLPIASATLEYSDHSFSRVTRINDREHGQSLHLTSNDLGRNTQVDFTLSASDVEPASALCQRIRDFQPLPGRPSLLRNRKTGRLMPLERLALMSSPNDEDAHFANWREFYTGAYEPWAHAPCIVIDTKRLDSLPDNSDRFRSLGHSISGRRLAASRIEEYLSQVANEIERAKDSALRINQSTDSSFAIRALDRAHATVKVPDLERRYSRVVEQHKSLAKNELVEGDPPIALPTGTNPTERRILAVFLEDWEQRLRPLLPVHEKISLFRELLDEKFADSHKRTDIRKERVVFSSASGSPIAVSNLSSGEQHLVALFTRLLFDAEPGSLVLIDEPEISLHPAWQHGFISDLDSISAIVEAQAIIATHSISIISEKWEIEVALTVPEPPEETNAEGDDALIELAPLDLDFVND